LASTAIIPSIDISSLFGPQSVERDATDRSLVSAASDVGFVTVDGLPDGIPVEAASRRELLRIFTDQGAQSWSQQRQQIDGRTPNLYRGWIATDEGNPTYNMGPDVAYGVGVTHPIDPLRQPTPLPPEAILPEWRAAAGAYYLGMERTGNAILCSLLRGLGLATNALSDAFIGGISTLRIIHYRSQPVSPLPTSSEQLSTVHAGQQRAVVLDVHADFGFVTLLAQDGVEGLQARMPDAAWVDVPPVEGALVVNFGKLLERLTGGHICATRHRVLSVGRERFSVPFFYEPRSDARLVPLPITGVEGFEAFVYGEHVRAASKRFASPRTVTR
jgi:isopenicillin N synthase-like dioxygenase